MKSLLGQQWLYSCSSSFPQDFAPRSCPTKKKSLKHQDVLSEDKQPGRASSILNARGAAGLPGCSRAVPGIHRALTQRLREDDGAVPTPKRGGFPAAPEAHLYPVQQFAHAPEAVGFDAPQDILRQVRHVEVLHVLLCKTDRGGESGGWGTPGGSRRHRGALKLIAGSCPTPLWTVKVQVNSARSLTAAPGTGGTAEPLLLELG